MAFRGNVLDFIGSPDAQTTVWDYEPETLEIVTECEYCGVQTSHTEKQLERDFRFIHKGWCLCTGSIEEGRH
jgi:hypothetical protein